MPFRPPLTREDLTRIRARYEVRADRAPCVYQDDVVWGDMLALLHEVKRLRAMLLRADQLRDRSAAGDPAWDAFVADLAAEPCVTELGEIKRELITAPGRR